MEKDMIMLSSKVDSDVYQQFKAALAMKNETIGQWVEKKITEEANTIKIEKV